MSTLKLIPSVSNVQELYNSSMAQSPVGTDATTNENILWTYTLPANTLDADGKAILISAKLKYAENSHTKTSKVYFGSTSLTANPTTTAPNGVNHAFQVVIVRKGASQQYMYFAQNAITAVSQSLATDASPVENLASTVVMKITGTNGTASANDIQLLEIKVSVCKIKTPVALFNTSVSSKGSILNQGTLTADAQALSTTATWNNSGVTFTGWKQNITDTASGSGSLLVDLQVGDSSKFSIGKSGLMTTGGNASIGGFVDVSAASRIGWAGLSRFTSPSDGVVTVTNNAGTDFSRLQFGGTTSSFPSLKRNGTEVQVRLADDSTDSNFRAASISSSGAYRIYNGATYVNLISATAPTISSGFGTSPSISGNNGTAAFEITVGTGATASSGVIGLPTASTGWNCYATNLTTHTANVFQTVQTASSTTSATITNYGTSGSALAWSVGDKLRVSCFAY